jgi:hypothetical protein
MTNWPFADPQNLAVFSVRQVFDGSRPIRLVCHDGDDGSWQFLTGEAVTMSDALIVSLASVFQFDPTIGELADLPEGWQAWREAIGQPWQRTPQTRSSDV